MKEKSYLCTRFRAGVPVSHACASRNTKESETDMNKESETDMKGRTSYNRNAWFWEAVLAALLLVLSLPTRAAASDAAEADSASVRHRVVLRTNLLYWATLSPNLSLDFRVADHWSLGLNYGRNFIPLHNTVEHPHTRRLRHRFASLETRYWTKGTFEPRSWFFGLNPIYSQYNVSRLFGIIYPSLKDHRREGHMGALGIFAGYTWRAGRLFRMEALAGAAGGYTRYKDYDCTHCGTYYGPRNRGFVMPQLALNLVLDPQKKAEPVAEPLPEPLPQPQPETKPQPVPFVPVFDLVQDNSGRAGELQKTNPILAHISEYKPYDESRILRKESGALYVYFPLDRTELRRDFRDNAEILDRIESLTRQIMSDSISTVKKIQIIGLASVEGPRKHNCELAEERAIALRTYLQERLRMPMLDQYFEVNYCCEAWSEFRDQVNDLRILKSGGKVEVDPGTPTAATLASLTPEVLEGISLDEVDRVLDIIDSEPDLDRREQRIRAINGGRTFKFMLSNILADQRNSGYLRVYYDYVPDYDALTINEAVGLLREERYAEALPLLRGVSEDSRAWNALGVALYMTGERDEAIRYFRRAVADGNAQAQKNLEGIGKSEK